MKWEIKTTDNLWKQEKTTFRFMMRVRVEMRPYDRLELFYFIASALTVFAGKSF